MFRLAVRSAMVPGDGGAHGLLHAQLGFRGLFAFSTNLYEVKAEGLFLEATTNLAAKAGFQDELDAACKAGAIERRGVAQAGRKVECGWLVARPGGKWALVDEAGGFARDMLSMEEAERAAKARAGMRPVSQSD